MDEFQLKDPIQRALLGGSSLDILNGGIYHHKVYAEFVHPTLAEHNNRRRSTAGDRLCSRCRLANPLCVVETKWMGKNMLSAEEIIWDLLRVELAAFYSW